MPFRELTTTILNLFNIYYVNDLKQIFCLLFTCSHLTLSLAPLSVFAYIKGKASLENLIYSAIARSQNPASDFHLQPK